MQSTRTNGSQTEKDPSGLPSEYQVKAIAGRGLPVPPTYGAAQELIDSFEPSEFQLRRLAQIAEHEDGDQYATDVATNGEAKQVIASFLADHPEVQAEWEAENASKRIERRQAARAEAEPKVTTPGMFKALVEAGITEVPSDYATAAAMLDNLVPSPGMMNVLQDHGRAVPGTRAAAIEVIRSLPATPEQVRTIMLQTRGRWAPKTRGEADDYFNRNRSRSRSGSRQQQTAAA